MLYDSYRYRVISQYKNKPKIQALFEVFVNAFEEAKATIGSLDNKNDISQMTLPELLNESSLIQVNANGKTKEELREIITRRRLVINSNLSVSYIIQSIDDVFSGSTLMYLIQSPTGENRYAYKIGILSSSLASQELIDDFKILATGSISFLFEQQLGGDDLFWHPESWQSNVLRASVSKII